MARLWAVAAAAALNAIGVSAQFLELEEDPATGVMSGRVSGLGADQTQYRIVTYVQDAAGLFSGPFEFPSATVASDGTFNMGTFPWDTYTAPSIAACVIPATMNAPPAQAVDILPMVEGMFCIVKRRTTPTPAPPPAPPAPPAASATATPSRTAKATVSASPSAAARGAITMTINAPALGVNGLVTGKLTGLPQVASAYKVGILVSGDNGATWWDKTHNYPTGTPQAVVLGIPLAADYSYSIQGWVSDPHDLTASLIRVIVMPQSWSFLWPGYQVEGIPYPANLKAAEVVSVTLDRTTGMRTVYVNPAIQPAASPAPPPAASPAASPAAGTVTITAATPPTGSTAAITGKVTGLRGSPIDYIIVVYVQAPEQIWYGPKPGIGATTTLANDWSFAINGWASGDPHDANVPTIGMYVVAAGSQIPNIIGAPTIPNIIASAATIGVVAGRGGTYTNSGSGSVPVPTPATTPTPTPVTPVTPAGQVTWPPGPTGAKIGAAGGFINFSGFRWVVKETRGARVGPGNNMFSSSIDNLYVDNWGLHLNNQPTPGGCDPWLSSEVWLDHALGYGSYLSRIVSPVEFVDPDVTWSPFFIWDDSGNAGNGWREIDIEFARWGNAGDPTSSQFVLKPLQGGGPPPGWRTRYITRNQPIFQGSGAGGGACNNPGQDNFNGMAVSKTTCLVKWFRTKIQWYCIDGLYTMATFPSAPQSALLSSYTYTNQQWISDPGDARVHYNLWLQNGARPRWGRRTHGIIHGFEFSRNDIAVPFPDNANIAQRSLQQQEAAPATIYSDGPVRHRADTTAGGGNLMVSLMPTESVNLTSGEGQSNGDPAQHSVALTLQASQDASASLAAGGSGAVPQPWEAPGYAPAGTTVGQKMSAGAIAGTVVGGVVGLASMFAAGYIVTRRRAAAAAAHQAQPSARYAAVPTSEVAPAAAGRHGRGSSGRTSRRSRSPEGGTELNPLTDEGTGNGGGGGGASEALVTGESEAEEEGQGQGQGPARASSNSSSSKKAGKTKHGRSGRVAPAASSSSSSAR